MLIYLGSLMQQPLHRDESSSLTRADVYYLWMKREYSPQPPHTSCTPRLPPKSDIRAGLGHKRTLYTVNPTAIPRLQGELIRLEKH